MNIYIRTYGLMCSLFLTQLWKMREWRKMRNHLFGFQDPEDLETFRAGLHLYVLFPPIVH